VVSIQMIQRNGRDATNEADRTDTTTASIIAFWPLHQLRLLRTFFAFVTYFLPYVARALSCNGNPA